MVTQWWHCSKYCPIQWPKLVLQCRKLWWTHSCTVLRFPFWLCSNNFSKILLLNFVYLLS